MSGYKFWTNVGVALASLSAGMAAAQAVTNITAASPCVVSYSGADPAAGNWLLLSVQGMTELDRRLIRILSVDTAANTLVLEDVDAIGYHAFVSGSFQVVTFDRTFNTLSEPSPTGGEAIFEDTTLIHDSKDSQAIVSSTPEGYGFLSVWEPGNAALVEANRAFVTKTPRCVLVTFADNSKYAFVATIAAPMAPGASGRKVTTPVNFALQNTGTNYAT